VFGVDMYKLSKNDVTIEQLKLVCRQEEELMVVGVTENYAIRLLELLSDTYAKIQSGGSATPHHVDQVGLWSVQALKIRDNNPDAKPRDHFRVEHGTPRRAFARLVLGLYQIGTLDEQNMLALVSKHWLLAVITLEEDRRLNGISRSKIFETPKERWAAAAIEFP
jgi:hypothetical protein